MKYKVGDKLKFISRGGWSTILTIGEIYTISEVDPANSKYCFKEIERARWDTFIEDPSCFVLITRSMKLKRILE